MISAGFRNRKALFPPSFSAWIFTIYTAAPGGSYGKLTFVLLPDNEHRSTDFGAYVTRAEPSRGRFGGTIKGPTLTNAELKERAKLQQALLSLGQAISSVTRGRGQR